MRIPSNTALLLSFKVREETATKRWQASDWIEKGRNPSLRFGTRINRQEHYTWGRGQREQVSEHVCKLCDRASGGECERATSMSARENWAWGGDRSSIKGSESPPTLQKLASRPCHNLYCHRRPRHRLLSTRCAFYQKKKKWIATLPINGNCTGSGQGRRRRRGTKHFSSFSFIWEGCRGAKGSRLRPPRRVFTRRDKSFPVDAVTIL